MQVAKHGLSSQENKHTSVRNDNLKWKEIINAHTPHSAPSPTFMKRASGFVPRFSIVFVEKQLNILYNGTLFTVVLLHFDSFTLIIAYFY